MGNTTDPIWTIDEYWDYPTNAFPDGVHAVRIHGGSSDSAAVCPAWTVSRPTAGLPAEVEQSALDARGHLLRARASRFERIPSASWLSDPDACRTVPSAILWCETSGPAPGDDAVLG